MAGMTYPPAGDPNSAGRPSSRITGPAIILVLAFVSSRLTGLLRDIAISYQFGTGRELDAYLAAIRLPDLVFQVAAGGAVAAAFIPIYSAYLVDGRLAEARRLLSAIFNLVVAGLIPVLVVVWIAAPSLIGLIAPGFEPEVNDLSWRLARILIVSPLLFTLGCFATSALNAHRRFAAAAVAPTMYNLGLIFGALVLSRWLGIYGLAWGAVLGSVLYLAVQVPGVARLGARIDLGVGLAHQGLGQLLKLMVPRTLALGAAQVNFVVVLALASPIAGAVSALNYAWLLTMIPLGVFAMAISTAAFPRLASETAAGDEAASERTAGQVLGVILYLVIPSTFGLIVVAGPLVALLFQRGAFDQASAAATSVALQVYAVGLLGMGATEILARLFYARQQARRPLIAAFAGMVVNAGLALALVGPFGSAGLAGAVSAASLVEAACLAVMIKRQGSALIGAGLLWRTIRMLVASIAMAALVWAVLALMRGFLGTSLLELLIQVAVALLVGVAAYLLFTTLAGLREAQHLRRLVAEKIATRL